MAYGTAPVYAEIMPLVMPSVSCFAAIPVLGGCFLMPLHLAWFDVLFAVVFSFGASPFIFVVSFAL
jgi:hypothetical protein